MSLLISVEMSIGQSERHPDRAAEIHGGDWLMKNILDARAVWF